MDEEDKQLQEPLTYSNYGCSDGLKSIHLPYYLTTLVTLLAPSEKLQLLYLHHHNAQGLFITQILYWSTFLRYLYSIPLCFWGNIFFTPLHLFNNLSSKWLQIRCYVRNKWDTLSINMFTTKSIKNTDNRLWPIVHRVVHTCKYVYFSVLLIMFISRK